MSKFENREKLSNIFKNYNSFDSKEVLVSGWIRNLRDSKKIAFIELNDGSYFKYTQKVMYESLTKYIDNVYINIG